ncbi:hypothetical protein [Limosilactobacillus mucosae]|uniref:Uncharacterized protein n=1 Tax=Limosilactobacillus mucosae TaxID=97478 RepID=A0AAJ1HPR9_LIMMU|nr:hypothetical protein [Limosilactobacillus mucosae]MDC2828454.1 hypothetical protein [Limosilactobacillus mucosae]MDC2834352.1 hypothetical protein [Limosilactobacillus mucosae]
MAEEKNRQQSALDAFALMKEAANEAKGLSASEEPEMTAEEKEQAELVAAEMADLTDAQTEIEEKQEAEEENTNTSSETDESNNDLPTQIKDPMAPDSNLAASAEDQKNSAPDFLENAERIPYSLQEEVMDWRRRLNNELVPENLVYATAVEATNYHFDGKDLYMLKMELANGAPIYIRPKEAGNNFLHISSTIGQTIKIAIDELITVPNSVDSEGHQEYIAMGSIRQAEFVIAGVIYQQLGKTKDDTTIKNRKPLEETRVGRIVRVLDRPYPGMLFIEYEGMTFGMLANNFYYRSYREPLTEVAQTGNQIRFKIEDINLRHYEDLTSVEDAVSRGRETPTGIFYQVMTTSLPFRENPDDKVRRLYKDKSQFLAHIVSVHPVKGILVEIERGWWIKGHYNPAYLNFNPTVLDAAENTPVYGTITDVDFKNHRGRFEILGFPRGVAKPK